MVWEYGGLAALRPVPDRMIGWARGLLGDPPHLRVVSRCPVFTSKETLIASLYFLAPVPFLVLDIRVSFSLTRDSS